MKQKPVVVVGAGPVGLSLALALRQAHIDTVVFEQRPGVPQDHRATTIQPPTLEMLQQWGVLCEVLGEGRKVTRLQYWDWPSRTRLADLDYHLIADDTACPYRVHLHQWRLCEILRSRLETLFPGTVRYGHKVRSITDRVDHVDVTVQERTGSPFTVEAASVAAADGHKSAIRTQLELEVEAMGQPQTFLSCEADLDVLQHLEEGWAAGATLFRGGDWAIVMVMKDEVRFLLRCPPEADAQSRDAMAERARALLGPGAGASLRSLSQYTVRPGVAQRLRRGRVVLLGDAAHAAYPVGGTAMNGGIHDAFHLAYALADGSDAALDRYATLRRQWATEQLVAHATVSMRTLSARGPFNRLSRNRHLRRVAADPGRTRVHLLRASMLGDRLGEQTLPEFS